MHPTIEDFAQRAFFHGLTAADVEAQGFEYRKGKTFADAKLAVIRGRDAGRGKLEHEISEAASRLARVLKKAVAK